MSLFISSTLLLSHILQDDIFQQPVAAIIRGSGTVYNPYEEINEEKEEEGEGSRGGGSTSRGGLGGANYEDDLKNHLRYGNEEDEKYWRKQQSIMAQDMRKCCLYGSSNPKGKK